MTSTSIIGFDSAWTDQIKAPGAVSVIRVAEGCVTEFVPPQLSSFAQALAIIEREREQVDRCFVALDQPTIVPNTSGSRPVDKVAASLISWIGGGVQPANRSKKGMFDDAAPVWAFKDALDAIENPEGARDATTGYSSPRSFPRLPCPAWQLSSVGGFWDRAMTLADEEHSASSTGTQCSAARLQQAQLLELPR